MDGAADRDAERFAKRKKKWHANYLDSFSFGTVFKSVGTKVAVF